MLASSVGCWPWIAGMLNWNRQGGVGERFKPPDCKSGARKGFVGSNPTPSTEESDNTRAHIAQR